MLWFNKKPVDDDKLNDGNAGAIKAHKTANKAAVRQAQASSGTLNRLFDQNGFTVKIVLAMGAKTKRVDRDEY